MKVMTNSDLMLWGQKISSISLLFIVIFISQNVLAEQIKPITSWQDIVIGRTTEDEIVAGNPGGSVSLSFREWSKIKQGQKGLHRLKFATECSYAQGKNKIDENASWWVKRGISKEAKEVLDVVSGQKNEESFYQERMGFTPNKQNKSYINATQKLDDCLKPELLNSGPISLKWNKLERANLEILSDGVVLEWKMQYWLGDLKKKDTLDKEASTLVSKDEILNLLKATLGSSGEKIKSDEKTETYNFLVGKRKLNVWLIYLDDGNVRYVEISEQIDPPTTLMQEKAAEGVVYVLKKLGLE